MNVEIYEQYYYITHANGFVEIVRRNSKFTSGYMSPNQLQRIKEIEATLETE